MPVSSIPARLITAQGAAPSYAARAWVNFNGAGTVAIRASGNVTSLTDHGVGDYTVNFTTAMPDANYAFVGMSEGAAAQPGSNVGLISKRVDSAQQLGSMRFLIGQGGTGSAVPTDNTTNCVAFFR